MAQLVLAAAGAAVGFAVGGPAGARIGFTVGSLIGSAFAPQQKVNGPRLDDLKVSGTEYGQPIPYVEGTVRIAGQLIWASELRETETEVEGGKGGGSAGTQYSYDVDLLFLLTENEIAGVGRAWYNGELVRNPLANADVGTVLATESNDLYSRFTVYTGADDQLPDPDYEVVVGAADALAYIGRGTVFIKGLQLGSSSQIGNWTFEVISAGAVADQGGDESLVDVSSVFEHFERPDPISFYQTAVYENTAWFLHNNAPSGTTYTVYKSKNFGPLKYKRRITLNSDPSGFDPVWVQTNGSPRFLYWQFLGGDFLTNGIAFISINPDTGAATSVLTYTPAGNADTFLPERRKTAFDEVQERWAWANVGFNSIADPDVVIIPSVFGTSYASTPSITGLVSIAAWDGHVYALAYSSSHWRVRRYDYAGTFVDEVEDTANDFDYGSLSLGANDSQAWIRVDASGQAWVFGARHGRLWKITTVFEEVSTAARTDTYAYTSEIIDGVFHCTESYAAWGYIDVTGSPDYVDLYLRNFKARSVVSSTVEGVVTRLLLRTGLDGSQFDVSDLANITAPVRGMSISQVTPARQVLEPLAKCFYFYCTLTDKLYFRRIPTASVQTLTYDELGATEGDATNSEPLQLDYTNQLEEPSQTALTYINASADYNVATEYSDVLVSDQNSVAIQQVPIVFTPAEAKAIADTEIIQKATAKIRTTISLMMDRAKLEPGDIVTVPNAAGDQFLFRLLKRDDSGAVLKFDAVLFDVNARTSSALTDTDYTESSVVAPAVDTELVLLDIATLRDADDELGIYAVAHADGFASPGCQLFKSPDDVTFQLSQSITETASVGVTTSGLTTWARGNRFDESSTVTVVMYSGTLSSYTRDQILSGLAPLYLIGDEIVYAKNATLTATDTYTLSGFLRGRKGTDWAMSGHAAGEQFVVLTTRGIRRERFDTSELSATRYFKAVTLGRRVSSADSVAITFDGVSKKPYSPCNLRAERLAAGTSDDPNFGQVALLLHGEGTNLAQVITDNSTFGRTPTVSGNTQTRTAQFQFGTSSIYFDGTGDYITYTSMPNISGDFVLDLWIRPDSVTAGQSRVLFDNRTSSGDAQGFVLYCFATGVVFRSNATNLISSGAVLAANTWAYIKLRRVSGVVALYVNGALAGTYATTQNYNRGRAVLGRADPTADQHFIGYMDEIRLKVGDGEAGEELTVPLAAYDDVVQDSSTTLTWNRRTRLSKNFTTGTAPLGESSEAYDVLIYSNSGFGTVLRTERVTEAEFVYSRADQIDDFGSFQSTLYAEVYQISATVGRGYKLRGTV